MEYSWLLAPVLVGLCALVANIILGRQVLKRGVIFIDLAMAQIAALGVLTVELSVGHASASLESKLFASWGLTLPAAFLLSYLERKVKRHLEALIGLLYVLAACLAILLVSHNPHGKEMIASLLNGRLLWSGLSDVIPVLVVAMALVVIQTWCSRWLSGHGFYLLFAIAVPPLVMSLGVYLEFASLIIPALAVVRESGFRMWFGAVSVGVIGGIGGFYASLIFDYPVGPFVVLGMAITGLIFAGITLHTPAKLSERHSKI
ncbi:zinc ABC transporter permease [Vibrio fortis]|uniref:Zinc ABC transporter permease n=1 Tax=Vibrio fortis TaxID=212667 RepID=A0A5N3S0F7_9VIBR|nr:metal ABC transporter permease [Vibrio fortis]KAB0300250.1 zinc ABC transporter permease [Vibrio fortis]